MRYLSENLYPTVFLIRHPELQAYAPVAKETIYEQNKVSSLLRSFSQFRVIYFLFKHEVQMLYSSGLESCVKPFYLYIGHWH